MEQTKQKNKLLIAVTVLAAILLLLVTVLNLSSLNHWLKSVLVFLRPALIGLVLAYLCNSFFRFFERTLFAKIKPHSVRRVISLTFTYLTLLMIFVVLLLLIIPQLVDSILNFVNNYESYLDTTLGEITKLVEQINAMLPMKEDGGAAIPVPDPAEIKLALARFFASLNFNMQDIVKYLSPEFIGSVVTVASNVASIITDTVFGVFISLYLLSTKEKRYAQIMRMRTAFFSDRVNARITRICTVADRSFGSFLKGKLLDSSIVGVLVYIALTVLNVPYAILIATIVGITDVVPIIGPFIGVIPSAIIILLTDPSKVIPFLLCILIIQQIDGNIIAPKILGENTGISSLCVMIAITTMGSLMGLVGMVIGVPLFATVGELFSSYLDGKLKRKGLPVEDAAYDDPLSVQGEEKKPSLLRRLYNRLLRLRANTHDGGRGDLTDFEKNQLEIYAAMQKSNYFNDNGTPSDVASAKAPKDGSL